MLNVDIPGFGELEIENLVLDINGTISLKGEMIPGVADRLNLLARDLTIYAITADTRGNASKLIRGLDIRLHRIEHHNEDIQKRDFIRNIGRKNTVSVGNGYNDAFMLKESLIGICVIGGEGAALDSLLNADVIVNDINDGLDLLLNLHSLIATLRR